MPKKKTTTKKASGRPQTVRTEDRAEFVSARPRPKTRGSVNGNRDILTVHGKDPDFEYRWVVDTSENGQRLMKFLNAWWEFVRSDDGVEIGEESVYKSDNVGSIIRTPAGGGKFNYLMKIRKEYYEEDQQAFVARIDETERAITRTDTQNGQYGEVKITRD